MSRTVKAVSDMEFDEVSLVDLPANQHARVALAKRAPQEDPVADYFDEDGDPVDLGELAHGDVVFDGAGEAFYWDESGGEDEEPAEMVAKRDPGAVFGGPAPTTALSKSAADAIREELSKAVTEGDRDQVIAKALGEISKAEQRAAQAEEIAKGEQTLRLTREYISKAAEYNVPIAAEELGPVLMGLANAEFAGELPEGSCAVIHKALSAAGEMLYVEAGFDGNADNLDPFAQVDAVIEAQVAKSAQAGTAVSKAHATADFFDSNPRAYDEYVAGLGR